MGEVGLRVGQGIVLGVGVAGLDFDPRGIVVGDFHVQTVLVVWGTAADH